MAKGLNSAVAKSQLVKSMTESSKKLEFLRWADTEEGTLALIKEKSRRELDAKKNELAIGQLVWRMIVVDNTDPMSMGDIINRCSKIVSINDETNEIDSEFIFAIVNGIKVFSFVDDQQWTTKLGDIHSNPIDRLEKHTAKNGNTWWKVV